MVRYNYSAEERKGLVELVSYIKSIGSMMQRCDTLVADALWETIHAEVQDFVQNTLATMLRTTFRKKKDLSRWAFALVFVVWPFDFTVTNTFFLLYEIWQLQRLATMLIVLPSGNFLIFEVINFFIFIFGNILGESIDFCKQNILIIALD